MGLLVQLAGPAAGSRRPRNIAGFVPRVAACIAFLFCLGPSCTDIALSPTEPESAAVLCQSAREDFEMSSDPPEALACGAVLSVCANPCEAACDPGKCGCGEPIDACLQYVSECRLEGGVMTWCERVLTCCDALQTSTLIVKLTNFEEFAGFTLAVTVRGHEQFVQLNAEQPFQVTEFFGISVAEGEPVLVSGFLDTDGDHSCQSESSFRLAAPAWLDASVPTITLAFDDQELAWSICD